MVVVGRDKCTVRPPHRLVTNVDPCIKGSERTVHLESLPIGSVSDLNPDLVATLLEGLDKLFSSSGTL